MSNPWDRPGMSFAPNRFGDRSPDPIYLALGKSVSAWEGVQVASANLFQALVMSTDEASAEDKCWQFAKAMKVPDRARKIRAACQAFLAGLPLPVSEFVVEIFGRIDKLMDAYVKWSDRRNELAHGYVTPAWGDDPISELGYSEEHFSLCPSHARLHYWNNAEPYFNYVAVEIAAFAEGFTKLDADLEAAAKEVSSLKPKAI
jgi:hypothetical protein